MNRRAPLPGAAELFRSTSMRTGSSSSSGQRPAAGARLGSGRQKHDSKITVYLSDAELVALEQARLAARADYGLAVDRGRIVREAVAVLLDDFEKHGEESLLVRRLRREPGR